MHVNAYSKIYTFYTTTFYRKENADALSISAALYFSTTTAGSIIRRIIFKSTLICHLYTCKIF